MKLSVQWLRERISTAVSNQELVDRLTLLGLEVENLSIAGPDCSQIFSVQILSIHPHPTREKLSICKVDCGRNEVSTVVCGADNIAVGLIVPFAPIGACLPDGKEIKEVEISGVLSQGVLCSSAELGLTDIASGVMILPPKTCCGEFITKCLQLDEMILEFSLTPNRGDCLSVIGIAREVSAAFQCDYRPPSLPAIVEDIPDIPKITIIEPRACPSYHARYIKGIAQNIETPLWISEKLRRSGIRTVHPIVDITNLVMLEFGQPLHSFDASRLIGDINVRFADVNEHLILLDNKDYELTTKTLVIADAQQPIALAGIMGGADSAVDQQTHDILLESAYFSPDFIIGRARQYGLHTDASHRFERGVDPNISVHALDYATALIQQICGGQAGPMHSNISSKHIPTCHPIILTARQIKRSLGIMVPEQEIETILTKLGMKITREGEHWRVLTPSWRFDICQEIDLIEELVRFYGYDKLPLSVPKSNLQIATSKHHSSNIEGRMRHTLMQRGFQEVMTYSFINPAIQEKIFPNIKALPLINPISPKQSVMRTSLILGLLDTLAYNLNRQQQRARLFEIGLVFKDIDKLQQINMIAGAVFGDYHKIQWDMPFKSSNLFDLKQDVEMMLDHSGLQLPDYTTVDSDDFLLHPGQSMNMIVDGQPIGFLGALHPKLVTQLDLPNDIYLFEIEIEKLALRPRINYNKPSKYPAVHRDIALLVDVDIAAGEIMIAIQNMRVSGLIQAELFDVYQGEDLNMNEKSLAIRLVFQDGLATLTDEDVDSKVLDILKRTSQMFGAKLRG